MPLQIIGLLARAPSVGSFIYASHLTICPRVPPPNGSAGKESTCSAGDLVSIPGLGRSPREGNPLQYSGLENSMHSLPPLGLNKSKYCSYCASCWLSAALQISSILSHTFKKKKKEKIFNVSEIKKHLIFKIIQNCQPQN